MWKSTVIALTLYRAAQQTAVKDTTHVQDSFSSCETGCGYVRVNIPLWRNKDCIQLFLVSIIAPYTENRLYICKQCKTLECN